MSRLSISLRTIVVSMVLFSLLPIVLITVYSHFRLRTVMTRHIQHELEVLTAQIASNSGDLADQARQLLQSVSKFEEVRERDPRKCETILKRTLSEFPAYLNLGAATPEGKVFCSALPMKTSVDISDRTYFREAIDTGSFAIGNYQVGRISGKQSINFGYPVDDDMDGKGTPNAVVFAAMDLKAIAGRLEDARLPEGSVLSVFDRNGKILMRYPDSAGLVGKVMPDADIIETVLSMERGETVVKGLDNVRRIYAFAPLLGSGVFITIGIPESIAYAEANRILAVNLMLLMIIALSAFVSSFVLGEVVVVKSIRGIANAMRLIGEGNLAARADSGIGKSIVIEISRFANSFDNMAASLEKNIAERERAQRELMNSEEKFRSMLENSSDIITVLSGDGTINYVSPSCTRVLGYKPEEMTGNRASDFVHEGDLQALSEAFAKVIAEPGRIVAQELRLRRQDGSFRNLEAIGKAVRDEFGDVSVIVNARDITEHKRYEERIEDQVEKLDALRKIDVAIISSLDLKVSLDIFLEHAIARLHVDAADILLLDPHSHTLECRAARGFRGDLIQYFSTHLGVGCAGTVALERRPMIIPDIYSAKICTRSELIEEEGFVSYVGVPLVARGDVKGVFEVFGRSIIKLEDGWLDFVYALTNQAAIAIDNSMMFDDLRSSHDNLVVAYDATIEGWARALDYRDKETEGHSRRVTDMTVAIAMAIGMEKEEIEHARRGALLHDIGKLGVPDSILLKPGKLTPEEWEIMKRHPVIAHDILSPVRFLRPAIDIPYCHHEKWDGSGYPRGLKGDAIPLQARIFSVVDVWDALTSDRPYRPAWSREKTMEEIRACSGTHFDTEVVKVFLSMKW